MTCFFDTSALAKRYTGEPEGRLVARLLDHHEVALSRLSEVEVTSALARLEREGAIKRREMEATIHIMLSEFAFWRVVDIDPEVTALAREVAGRHPLRANEAIQLATALLIERRFGKRLDGFVVFDRRLATAARGEDLAVIGA